MLGDLAAGYPMSDPEVADVVVLRGEATAQSDGHVPARERSSEANESSSHSVCY